MTSADLKTRVAALAPDGWELLDVSPSVTTAGWRLHWSVPGDRYHVMELGREEVDGDRLVQVIRGKVAKAQRKMERTDAGMPSLGQWVGHGNVRVTAIDTEAHTATLSDGRTVKWEELRALLAVASSAFLRRCRSSAGCLRRARPWRRRCL